MRTGASTSSEIVRGRSGLLYAAVAAFLLSGCAGDPGIFPTAGLPPQPAGPPPEFPSLVAPAVVYDEDAPVLSSTEIQQMEARLGRLPAEREATVRHRILSSE